MATPALPYDHAGVAGDLSRHDGDGCQDLRLHKHTVEGDLFEVLKVGFDPIGVLGSGAAPAQALASPYGAGRAAKSLLNQNRSFFGWQGWSPELARGLAKCALDKSSCELKSAENLPHLRVKASWIRLFLNERSSHLPLRKAPYII